MPFRSQKQRNYMWKNKPAIAKEWEEHTPKGKKLPTKVKRKAPAKTDRRNKK